MQSPTRKKRTRASVWFDTFQTVLGILTGVTGSIAIFVFLIDKIVTGQINPYVGAVLLVLSVAAAYATIEVTLLWKSRP